MKKLYLVVILLLLPCCIFVPVIDSFKKAGLTANDRRALLTKNLKAFHDAVHWGNITEAVGYAASDNMQEISNYLQEKVDEEKIVESKVKTIKFDDGAYKATVDIKTRAYKVGVYVVEDRIERETWECSLSDSWRITLIEKIVK